MDSLITAAARALAAGDPLGALKRVALRDDPPALALRGIAMAQLGDFVAREGPPAKCGARLRSERGRGPRAMRRRRGRDRARIARPELAAEGARRGAGDARTTRRPGERRACAASRGPAPSPDRASRRGRACARRARSRALPARVEGRPRTGRCGHRDAPPADQGGARRARPGRARRAPGRHPCTDGGGRKRIPCPQHARGAPDCARRGATPSARGGRSGAGVGGARRGRVPPCRARAQDTVVSLARRPVLFALARALAEAWPGDVSRDALVARAFRAKHADKSHRARLRVEIGRLRAELRIARRA